MNDEHARKVEYFECCSHDCNQGRFCPNRIPEGGTVLTLATVAFVSILALLVGLVIALFKQFGGV